MTSWRGLVLAVICGLVFWACVGIVLWWVLR